jgi:hypothetical protein
MDAARSASGPYPQVLFKPSGNQTALENCRSYAPLLAEAARHKADLVVLGECVTFINLGQTETEVAEPIPGPATEYFGTLARQPNLDLVARLNERVAAGSSVNPPFGSGHCSELSSRGRMLTAISITLLGFSSASSLFSLAACSSIRRVTG